MGYAATLCIADEASQLRPLDLASSVGQQMKSFRRLCVIGDPAQLSPYTAGVGTMKLLAQTSVLSSMTWMAKDPVYPVHLPTTFRCNPDIAHYFRLLYDDGYVIPGRGADYLAPLAQV